MIKPVYFKLLLVVAVFIFILSAGASTVNYKLSKLDTIINNSIANSNKSEIKPSIDNQIPSNPTSQESSYRKLALQSPKYTDGYEKELTDMGKIILNFLKNKEMDKIAKYVHDDLGLTIKPYYSTSQEQGRILNSEQVNNFFNDSSEYLWGLADGSGLPMVMTNKEYFENELYNYDFLNADYFSYNRDISAGNNYSLDIVVSDIYDREQNRFIEYYFGGFEEQYEGMDWQALALVFVKLQDKWYLAGILHNEWTI